MINMTILQQWQSAYCAGNPMSDDFREMASTVFQCCYDKIKITKQLLEAIEQVPKKIYRILSEPFDINQVKANLYYSFSGSKKGILEVAKKDRYLKSDITLLIATPVQALNYNLLGEGYERYAVEEEIVSKINNKSIIKILHFEKIDDLEKFLNEGDY